MSYSILLNEAKGYVISMFDSHKKKGLSYHNKAHTQFVVDSAKEIANHYQLNERDYFILMIAAWFHDTGYLNKYENHNEESLNIANTYLESAKIDKSIIAEVNQCIIATKVPQKPKERLSEILCDADTFHMGQNNFNETNKLLKKEIETITKRKISKESWRLKTIELFEAHQYFTDYCKVTLNKKTNQNLEKFKKRNEKKEINQIIHDPHVVEHEHSESGKKNKNIPDKSAETMFRIASNNNQRLSDLADRKAHIVITVNSIILSAIISLVLRKLDTSSFILIPTCIQLTVSVTSIIFSILSTRPRIPQGIFSIEDIEQKKVNLLFFGNFYKMKLNDYSIGMQKVMGNKKLLYHTLVMDVYSQGVVLGRKYHQLRIAYSIFMFGLIISAFAYVLAILFHNAPIHAIPH
ncbi:MAG: phosphohydrolase [Mucilaginibacter sp.]|nr:phosphohydrolase [Mucilaginibacter sp.]